MYSIAINSVYGIMYLTVPRSAIFALVSASKGSYRRQSLVQFPKLSSSQTLGSQSASEGLGATQKNVL